MRAEEVADLCVSPGASLRDAIRVIDQAALQLALVADDQGRLLGTVTDGDIRRGLLSGDVLDDPVDGVMNRAFHSLSSTASDEEAFALMRREGLHQVPAIDAGGRVVGLFTIEDMLRKPTLANWVIVMAGGEGKRLRPLTESLPKPMLVVGGRPMLEITVERCVRAGLKKIFVSVNYLREHIIEHFGDGSLFGADLQYLDEAEPLGTAGSLGLLPERPHQPILVVNGDILSRVDFGALLEFHATHQAAATICVRAHETQIPFGVIHADGLAVQSMEEKPVLTHYVNAGIYVISPTLLDLLPADQPCDMPELLELALGQGLGVSVFPVHEYWLDVGNHERLNQANGEWS